MQAKHPIAYGDAIKEQLKKLPVRFPELGRLQILGEHSKEVDGKIYFSFHGFYEVNKAAK